MKIKLTCLLTIFLLLANCQVTKPGCLLIENRSQYEILVLLKRGLKRSLPILPGKTDFTLLYPGRIKIEIRISSIGFCKHYVISINYQEQKKLIFQL